jgi:hypothetical protein
VTPLLDLGDEIPAGRASSDIEADFPSGVSAHLGVEEGTALEGGEEDGERVVDHG